MAFLSYLPKLKRCTFSAWFFHKIFPYLKELRDRILRTTFVWSLFCLIPLYVGLHFSTSSFRKLVFHLSVLSLNQDIKIKSCYVILICSFVLNFTYIKTQLFINNKLFKNVLYIALGKNMLSGLF